MRTIRSLLLYPLACCCGLLSFASCEAHPVGASSDDDIIKTTKVLKTIGKEKSCIVNGKHIAGDFTIAEAGDGARIFDDAPVYIDCEIAFVNCVFEDEVSASLFIADKKQYLHPVFLRGVSFVGCTFMKKVSLNDAVFRDRLVLNRCTFRQSLSATGIKAIEGAQCNDMECEMDATFSDSYFGCGTSFVNLNVKGDFFFQNARIEGYLMMTDGMFGRYVELSGVNARACVDLSKSKVGGRVASIGSQWHELRLAGCAFADDVTFEDTYFWGKLNIQNASFGKALTMRGNVFVIQPNMEEVLNYDKAQLVQNENVDLSSE